VHNTTTQNASSVWVVSVTYNVILWGRNKTDELPVSRPRHALQRVRRARMGPPPHEYPVLFDRRIDAVFERARKETVEAQPRAVRETVNPGVRRGLRATDCRADVV
jgi:hypothetical protein